MLSKWLAGASISLLIAAAFLWWQNQSLVEDNAISEAALASNNAAILSYAKEIESRNAALSELKEGYKSAQQRADELYEKIAKEDYTELFKGDPDHVERIVNGDTSRLFNRLRKITGATRPGKTLKALADETAAGPLGDIKK